MARKAVPAYSSKYSKKTYTQHQHIVLLCLKVREGKMYDDVVDMVKEMPRIREAIGLKKVIDPSTCPLSTTSSLPDQIRDTSILWQDTKPNTTEKRYVRLQRTRKSYQAKKD